MLEQAYTYACARACGSLPPPPLPFSHIHTSHHIPITQVLHGRIEMLARLAPRAQHQRSLAASNARWLLDGVKDGLAQLSARSSPSASAGEDELGDEKEDDEEEDDDEGEIPDMMISDGLTEQLKMVWIGWPQ